VGGEEIAVSTRAIGQLVAAAAVFTAAVVAIALLVVHGGGDTGTPKRPTGDSPAPPPASSRSPAPRTGAGATGPALAVKIDNVKAARPQTGLAAADVVYVEPVEGGLTRLVAVYSSHLPGRVGPVRSARQTDIELLAQYGHPTLAYSGSAPELVPALRASSLLIASQGQVPGAYARDPARPPPHNLYLDPARVPRGSGQGPRQVLEFGAPPLGGEPTTGQTVRYPGATYRVHWSSGRGRWLINLNGTPLISLGAGPVAPATVVIQQVTTRPGSYIEDATGAVSPVVRTVGTGKATVLREGKTYSGTWSRPAANAGTRLRTASGAALPLADGPVWILLVPR
jgi:hypothetical protein